jgi:hypothetical protein
LQNHSDQKLFANMFVANDATVQNESYRAYPNLKSARWILPTNPIHRRGGIAAYRPAGLYGRSLKALIRLGLLRGEPAPLASKSLDRVRRFIARTIEVPDVALSLLVGTPGAYQKHTLRIMRSDGSALAYAKLADNDLSKRKVVNEHAILTRLSSVPNLEGMIPKVLFFGELEDCLVIVTTPGSDTRGPHAFSALHWNFLKTLHAAFGARKSLFTTKIWASINDTLKWLSGRASATWLSRIDLAVRYLRSELQDENISLSLAHRDFTPWNTCSLADGIFVFDWEDAIFEAPPLHDVFHFHAIQDALARRKFRRNFASLMDIESKIRGTPEVSSVKPESLFLFYLVDVASYYMRATLESPHIGNTLVLDWAERELDYSISQWKHTRRAGFRAPNSRTL